jgi:hypothetical protein
MYKLQQNIKSFFIYTISIFLLFFCCSNISFAQEYNSTNYKILEPVQTSGGGYSFSTSYKLDSTIGQIGIGTSSATNFGLNAGFLYFPYVSTPVISATAGNGQVSLSWTGATGVLGWTASGYDIGYSTVSGGSYIFGSSLGNVLSTVQGSLTNGISYYFIIRVEDAFGNIIATSTEVSATPVAPAVCTDHNANNFGGALPCTYTPPPSGGGGGGGGGFYSATSVIFSGKAYPKSIVTLLKDAQIISNTVAGTDASFTITLNNLTAGNYIFSMYSEDKNGLRSSLLTFPVSVTAGATTNVSGIFLAPTIAVDKSEVKRGDDIAIFGQSVPQSNIVISVHSDEEYFSQTISDKDGIYLYNFDTSFLDLGSHVTKSKASIGNQLVSGYSNAVNFKVGTQNIAANPIKACPVKGDLNNDCRVNLVDFSIASYWYKRPLSDAFKVIEISKLNGDGKVNLVDFSIMAYYWTG